MLEIVDKCKLGWHGMFGGGDLSCEGGWEYKIVCFLIFVMHYPQGRCVFSGEAFSSYDFLCQAITSVPDRSEQAFAVTGVFKLFL